MFLWYQKEISDCKSETLSTSIERVNWFMQLDSGPELEIIIILRIDLKHQPHLSVSIIAYWLLK